MCSLRPEGRRKPRRPAYNAGGIVRMIAAPCKDPESQTFATHKLES